MAPNTPPPSSNNGPGPDNKEPILPDEQFWQRYSPHHEFPLSTVTSILLHSAVFALVIYGVIIANKLGLAENKPLPLDAIVIAGGGGNVNGVGDGPGTDVPPPPGKEVIDNPDKTPKPPIDKPPDVTIKDPDITPTPDLPKATSEQSIPETDTAPLFAGVSQQAQQELSKLLRDLPPAGKGQGGTGSGGGQGKGRGTGEGDLTGAGKGTINERQKRVLRWTMHFDTFNGHDYIRQLNGLGAYLAVPMPQGGYEVIKNLSRPPFKGDVEDLSTIKRIFWVDDTPDSVRSITAALQLPFTPPHIVAFFPEELEKTLLQKELAYRGLSEDQIKKTNFRVQNRGGKFEPVVESQE